MSEVSNVSITLLRRSRLIQKRLMRETQTPLLVPYANSSVTWVTFYSDSMLRYLAHLKSSGLRLTIQCHCKTQLNLPHLATVITVFLSRLKFPSHRRRSSLRRVYKGNIINYRLKKGLLQESNLVCTTLQPLS